MTCWHTVRGSWSATMLLHPSSTEVLFGMRCILEGVHARKAQEGEHFETFDAAYASLADDVVLNLDRATMAALAAARVSPAPSQGGRTQSSGRAHAGALAVRLTSWVTLQQIGCTRLSFGCKLRAFSSQFQRS